MEENMPSERGIDINVLLSLLGNGTANPNGTSEDVYENYYKYFVYFNIFDILVSIVTLFFGFISWTLLPKWRSFKNYVLLNIAAAAFFKHLVLHLINFPSAYFDYFYVYYYVYDIFVFAHNFWMVIMSAVFYSSVVKIFRSRSKGRFLNSALIAWVIPVILAITDFILSGYNVNYGLPRIINSLIFTVFPNLIQLTVFIMYTMVLWNLLKSSTVRRSNENISAKVQLATLLLLMSGVTSITCQIVDTLISDTTVFTLLMENVDLISNIIVCVWVLATKSNRDLWVHYYRNKIRKRNVNTVF